jgi:hypothetical protein
MCIVISLLVVFFLAPPDELDSSMIDASFSTISFHPEARPVRVIPPIFGRDVLQSSMIAKCLVELIVVVQAG